LSCGRPGSSSGPGRRSHASLCRRDRQRRVCFALAPGEGRCEHAGRAGRHGSGEGLHSWKPRDSGGNAQVWRKSGGDGRSTVDPTAPCGCHWRLGEEPGAGGGSAGDV
ncbi:unnamed protein product, partial [Polarella glacialis]